jgi:hypothetical protein
MKTRIASLALAFAIAALPALALASSFVESVNGDMSNNRAAPSSLALDPGDNLLTGTTVAGDLDYITLSAPAAIIAIKLTQFDTQNPSELAFVAIQAGTVFTEPNTGTTVANLLGYSHIGNPVGTDYLPIMGTAAGAIGFTPPLTGPNYTLWIQQTGANVVSYTLDVVVPEPSALALLAFGFFVLATQSPVRRTLASHRPRARSAS